MKQDRGLERSFEAELDAALRLAPEVHAPNNFRQELMAQLPARPAAWHARSWPWPSRVAIAGVVLGALAVTALQLGLAAWLVQPATLFAILIVESATALVWFWRTAFSRR